MSTWSILRDTTNPQTGQPTVATVATTDAIEYHGEWMGDEYVLVTVNSPTAIDFQLNDYIIYRNEHYYLNNDANVVKKARSGTHGEGFVYSNIKLYSVGYLTHTIDFKDIVLEDNMIPYTSLSEFSFFADSVEDLADRLQANLARISTDWKVYTPNWSRCDERGCDPDAWDEYYGDDPSTYGTWGVTGTAATLGERDVNVSITSEQRCWDALALSYSSFGLSFYVKGYDIVIGAPALRPGHIFRYGKGNGLYEVERTSDDQQEIVSTLYAYGSEKNMGASYYSDLTLDVFATVTDITTGSYDYLDLAWSATMFTNVRRETDSSYYVDVVVNGTEYTDMVVFPYTDGNVRKVQITDDTLGGHIFSVGDVIYFTKGVRKHDFPSDHQSNSTNLGKMTISRLMLPGFPTQSLQDWVTENQPSLLGLYDFSTDPLDPWIRSLNYEYIGTREGVVNYDGSSQQEIYPTIENAGIDNTIPGGGAPFISDDGVYSEDPPTFTVVINNIFDIKEAIANSTDTPYISMKSGWCAGREFKIDKAVYNSTSDKWILTCERSYDDALQRYFPYCFSSTSLARLYQISVGDEFVLTGIIMPDEYVEAAAEKLLIAACGYLSKRDHVRYTYVPKIDEIRMARQHQAVTNNEDAATYGTVSLHDTIKAGMQLQVEDSDLGITRYGDVSPFIDQLTIKEGSTPVPEYDVVLRDEKEKSALEKLTEKVSDLKANPPTQVVERQQRTLQYIEYESWSEDGSYYFETLNTTTDVLETSMVWHKGCLWMCKRTLTTDEPWFTSEDWECVRSSALSLDFFDSLEDPMPVTGLSVRPASIDETVVPFFLISQQDISDEVTNWAWERDSGDADSDGLWNGLHTGALMRTLHLTTSDFPSGWQNNGGKVKFTCTATFPWSGENAQISNQITVV